MIAQLLNREFLLEMTQLASTELEVELKRRESTRRGGMPDELTPFDDEQLREMAATFGTAGRDRVALEPDDRPEGDVSSEERSDPLPKDDFAFVPQDPVLNLVQSALDEYFETKEHDGIDDRTPLLDDRRGGDLAAVTDRRLTNVPLRRTADGRRLWRPFEVAHPKILSDPRWALSLLAEGWRMVHKRADFRDSPPTVRIAEDVDIYLVGDWGSGLPRAQKVAQQIRAQLAGGRVESHVIHLGDVYYSGWANEYRRRFLNGWPVDDGSDIGSFSLNGNHDMYSGGHGYYEQCLADPRFARQAGCSFFALQNDSWQFLALDTSYEDGGLHGRQAQWARDLVEASPDRKNVLLSHHQLFSAHESGAKVLGEKIKPVLATGRVDGWFWGHEHRCIQYDETVWDGSRVGFASCVGHGGIPEYLVMKPGETMPAPWAYEFLKQYGTGWEPWDTFGHAVLELRGPKLTVRYIDEDGHEHHKVDAVGKTP